MDLDGFSMKMLPSHALVEPQSETVLRRDEAELARYGKKQQLRVFCNLLSANPSVLY